MSGLFLRTNGTYWDIWHMLGPSRYFFILDVTYWNRYRYFLRRVMYKARTKSYFIFCIITRLVLVFKYMLRKMPGPHTMISLHEITYVLIILFILQQINTDKIFFKSIRKRGIIKNQKLIQKYLTI